MADKIYETVNGVAIYKVTSVADLPGAVKAGTLAEFPNGDVQKWTGTQWIQTSFGGAEGVSPRKLAHERGQGEDDEYGVAVGEWGYTICTGDTVLTTNPALVKHVIVTVATATAAIDIRDATTVGTGTVVDSIPATTAVQTKYEFDGYKFNSGLVIDFGAGATGTVRVAWRDQ